MSTRKPVSVIAVAVTLCGLFLAAERDGLAQQTRKHYAIASRTTQPTPGKGISAIDAAARNGHYLFILFWKSDDTQTRSMNGVLQSAMKKWAESAELLNVKITDQSEKSVIDKFGVSRAPMPLVVALAPTGAITKAYPIQVTEQQLEGAFVSPGTAQCLKALQDGKRVLVCVQNEKTESGAAALRGVQSYQADKKLAAGTEVVTINPADDAEASFLQSLKVDPRTPTAITVLLSPPGQPVATFTGAVTKEQIAAKVAAAKSSSCCPGGSCCPK